MIAVLNAVLRAGALYFVIVFGAGFILGTIRTLLIVPRVGVRMAELTEMPIMLVVSFLAARFVIRRLGVPPIPTSRLAMGFVALGLTVAVEFGWRLVAAVFGFFAAARDPVAATAFYLALAVFAFMPLFVSRR